MLEIALCQLCRVTLDCSIIFIVNQAIVLHVHCIVNDVDTLNQYVTYTVTVLLLLLLMYLIVFSLIVKETQDPGRF